MARTPTDAKALTKKDRQRAAADEALLREVDDAVRQDDLATIGQRYGVPILIGLGLLLAAVAAYLIWNANRENAAEERSERLVAALDQVEAGNLDEALARIEPLLAEGEGAGGGGPAAVAGLLAGGIALERGDTAEAARAFAAVAADGDAPGPLRDLARVREAAALYDTLQPQQVIDRLDGLAAPGNPFFGSAGELVAMALLEQGKEDEAGALFAAISKDDDLPASLRSRTRQMAGLLGVDAIEDVERLLREEGGGAPVPGAGNAN